MEESKLTKIIVWNVVIYFLLCILSIIIPKMFLSGSGKDYLPLVFMILSMVSLSLQVLINLVLSGYYYLSGKKDLGLSFFISSLILLIIGIPICYSPFILSK